MHYVIFFLWEERPINLKLAFDNYFKIVINFDLNISRSSINVNCVFEYVLSCAFELLFWIFYGELVYQLSKEPPTEPPTGTPYFRNSLSNPLLMTLWNTLSNTLLEIFISEGRGSDGGVFFFKMLIYASIISFLNIHYTLIYNTMWMSPIADIVSTWAFSIGLRTKSIILQRYKLIFGACQWHLIVTAPPYELL